MNDEKELIDVARPLTSASVSTQLLQANDPFVPMLVSTGLDFQGTNSIQGVSVLEANTIIASNISGGGSVDMSGVEARLDTIIEDLSVGLPPIQASLDAISVDLSSSLPSLESRLDNINTGLEVIQGDISGVSQQLSSKQFQVFSNSGSPPLPYSANLIPTGCILRKMICDVFVSSPTANFAIAKTRFFDTGVVPVGGEPLILTELHSTRVFTSGITGSNGLTQHTIDFPDGGMVLQNGLGVICEGIVNSPQIDQFCITIYYE